MIRDSRFFFERGKQYGWNISTLNSKSNSTLIYPSQDQTIRVFRLEDHFNVYTLHGHCGPITAAFVDHGGSNNSGGSDRDHCAGTGSQVSHPQFTAGFSFA